MVPTEEDQSKNDTTTTTTTTTTEENDNDAKVLLVDEKKEQPQEPTGQEEDDTISTSSVQSLTPDNPVYGSGPLKDCNNQSNAVNSNNNNHTTTTTTTTTINEEGMKRPTIVNWHPSLPRSPEAIPKQEPTMNPPPPMPPRPTTTTRRRTLFTPHYKSTMVFCYWSKCCGMLSGTNSVWIGFWAMFTVTCANSVLTPMRDAIALEIGVTNLPKLTVASTALALFSSVPIGWLFEAPDPQRRQLWKRMGLTRGETQGTSLALFYRFFALSLLSYAVGFKLFHRTSTTMDDNDDDEEEYRTWTTALLGKFGQVMYVAFFLVVHLMKLHSLSLVWGVITEAMEYEDAASKEEEQQHGSKKRLQRLSFVGFGGTLGGILGRYVFGNNTTHRETESVSHYCCCCRCSIIASQSAHSLRLSGLLVVSACLLEVAAELSIELGRIMQLHWGQYFKSSDDLASLDTSMKRSNSMGSMKRVASGNSLHRVKSSSELLHASKSLAPTTKEVSEPLNDTSFTQRLSRGISTILRSRLLMAIFTYNALYASTTVLLSFQRAALVANRNNASRNSTAETDTAFLANINMASALAVFVLQASGLGAYVAHACGSRGTLTLMPLMRLMGIVGLAWWHRSSHGQPPNLVLFLVLDECTKVLNLAVAKPVRESLWRGLSNEARYEAKPIVDTLANRWGGGSAAFLVSLMDKIIDFFGANDDDVVVVQQQPNGNGGRLLFGYPPILLQCLIVAVWWALVSVDLGQIRRRIDLELKKHL